jgi:hypothetical protein
VRNFFIDLNKQNIDDTQNISANEALKSLISHAVDNGNWTPTEELGQVLQAIAAKSVAPIIGTKLPNIICTYMMLAFGLSAHSTTLYFSANTCCRSK